MTPLLLRTAFLFAVFLPLVSFADSDIPKKEPRIVGGQVAEENDWPWMSAVVFTFQEALTSLTVDNAIYETDAFSFGPEGNASGELIDCGIGDVSCSDAQNKVCLIERGEINFSVKVNNCEAGGGNGVIIYNNVEGSLSGTLGDDFDGAIPVVAVSQSDGAILKEKLGSIANVVVNITDLAQSSSCGASFLGDKWVLTAAHCVDEQQASQIKINVGEYDLSNGAENAIQVKRIYIHPEYNDTNFNNDIALLELDQSVESEAITIVDDISTANFAAENSLATVMGWGGRLGYEPGDGPTGDFPDILHQVDLQLLTNTQCENIYNGNYDITEAMICAYNPGGGKGSCQGDSGGPVVINTNQGWQQVGIVSWGVGCASEGNPGVYARASKFIDWIDNIKSGIAIEQMHDFGVSAQGSSQTYSLTVVNNTDVLATLNYTVEGDTLFTLVSGECLTIAAAESCELTVNYNATTVGFHDAYITLNSDNSDVLVSSSKVIGQTIIASPTLATQMATDTNITQWFSGGNALWTISSEANQIQSGAIGNSSESIAMMTFSGAGGLSFEWSVSSEVNEDDPSDPYDALYVYINDTQVDFISGQVDFELKEFTLGEGDHKVVWIYRTDQGTKELDDTGYVRNVSFSPVIAPIEPVNPITPEVPDSVEKSSSGGTFAWLSLMMCLLVSRSIWGKSNKLNT